MKKIKVVHISRGFEDYVLALLSTLGSEVDLYQVLAEADEWMAEEIPGDVTIVRSGGKRVSNISNFFTTLRLFWKIKKITPDVIHIQNGVVWEGIMVLAFPFTPKVVTVHDVTKHPTQSFRLLTPQFFLDYVVSRASSIIVHGEKLKEKARSYYKTKADIHVVQHGVITRYGCGVARHSPGTNVLLFGSIDKWKGIEYLVKAEPLIREKIPNLKIKICGGCKDPKYYQGLLADGQNIEMDLVRQTNDGVNSLFKWADVIVLPYIEASQSGVLNLAINYCLPAVVTDVGSLTDIIEDGVNGAVAESRDHAMLARKVIQLLEDESLRKKVVNNLKAMKSGEQGRDMISLKTKKVYLGVLG